MSKEALVLGAIWREIENRFSKLPSSLTPVR